jgi:transcriptional regulator with XRE-family HTH domain
MMNIGERIREARQRRQLSLAEMAHEVQTSVATLSRIETSKQSLDLGLFLDLARALEVSPAELLPNEGDRLTAEHAAAELPTLPVRDRLKFWQNLAAANKVRRVKNDASDASLAAELDELYAQIDLIRDDLDEMRKRLRRRARKS